MSKIIVDEPKGTDFRLNVTLDWIKRATAAETALKATAEAAATHLKAKMAAEAREAKLLAALRIVDMHLHEHGYEEAGTMRHTIRAAIEENQRG